MRWVLGGSLIVSPPFSERRTGAIQGIAGKVGVMKRWHHGTAVGNCFYPARQQRYVAPR
ncbi:hypothetical protein HH682_02755 [Rosenbergiella sp. S61]|uniref:Uncharacterized protein n=1 Tax=Rosenbergiella gaditana TaxID=2726987 RepID=A0ABS5STG0_9GAMM|nr:hypothetical protein [Rosenbergiella gaditana]MBT0723383.1 hypothetical protein [Rosenbergiella gaditana]